MVWPTHPEMGVSWLSVARTTVSVMVDRLASVNSPHTPGCQHPARRRRTISPATRRQPTTCCSRACDGEDVNMKPKAPRARQGRGGTRWEDFFRASQRAGLPTRARRSTTLRVRMDHRCFTRAMRRTNHAASPRVVERGVAPTQMPAPYPEEQTKRQAWSRCGAAEPFPHPLDDRSPKPRGAWFENPPSAFVRFRQSSNVNQPRVGCEAVG